LWAQLECALARFLKQRLDIGFKILPRPGVRIEVAVATLRNAKRKVNV
jgi:hypothetical protein